MEDCCEQDSRIYEYMIDCDIPVITDSCAVVADNNTSLGSKVERRIREPEISRT